jgi:hypothetical protein
MAGSLVHNVYNGANLNFINIYKVLNNYSEFPIYILAEECDNKNLVQVNSFKIGSNGIILQSQHRPHLRQFRRQLPVNFENFNFKLHNNVWKNANDIDDNEELKFNGNSEFTLDSIIQEYKECLPKSIYICNLPRLNDSEVKLQEIIYDNQNDIIVLHG